MEHLMNQLVGRSIAQERERDLVLGLAVRRAESSRPRRTEQPRPPRPRRGGTPLVAPA